MNSIIARYNYKNVLILFLAQNGLKFGVFLYKETNNNRYDDYEYMNNNYKKRRSKMKVLVPKSFLFSFNNNQIYYLDSYDKIICFNNVCPNEDNKCSINFCNDDLINNDKNIDIFVKVKNISFGTVNENNKYFKLQEIEVFQVNYNNYYNYNN